MKIADAIILIFSIEIIPEILKPIIIPITIKIKSASIAPAKMKIGLAYLAARATTASCVLSPSSIRAINEKLERKAYLPCFIIASSGLESKVYIPNKMKIIPEPNPTQNKGMYSAMISPANTLTPSIKAKAIIDPAKTEIGLNLVDNVITASCVLSPISAAAIMTNEARNGVKSNNFSLNADSQTDLKI